jgi:FtsZ-binding cell division protein ZapB
MTTLLENPVNISADEFQALEEKVLRAVELIKAEREARAALAKENHELQKLLDEEAARATALEATLNNMQQERETVRQRVDKLLGQLDEIG